MPSIIGTLVDLLAYKEEQDGFPVFRDGHILGLYFSHTPLGNKTSV